MDKKTLLKRLQSPVTLMAILSQAVLIVALFNNDIANSVKIAGTAVIEILTLFGIVNNPGNKNQF